MYRENYINSLRAELVAMVADHLTPVALKYGYSEVPLETNIKWRPQVLVIGNYSSGKSTLINEFLGANIQSTGQAPTDDSFTILTYEEPEDGNNEIRVLEERDGKYLLNDPEYPYEILKKHGHRFASHFRLKKINSPFLKNLAIIDTPGMLDSITERDRGYDYQEVVGDLAQVVDLVLVLFDPHKAGTVREAHKSLRETLPLKTFEDRVLYVLNRIDECSSLNDLLRVYGTLCWNLSQITGRKDIPMIHLTYSPRAVNGSVNQDHHKPGFLDSLQNQRDELRKAINQAPRQHLDHLAAFVETHGERLAHILESLTSYKKNLRVWHLKYAFLGILVSILAGGASTFAMMSFPLVAGYGPYAWAGGGGAVAACSFAAWMTFIRKFFRNAFHRKQIAAVDGLTTLENQTRRDVWESVKGYVVAFLERSGGRFSYASLKREFSAVRQIRDEGSREIREALGELYNLREESRERQLGSDA